MVAVASTAVVAAAPEARAPAAGGGGGSSLGDSTTAGVNDGDGQVTITPSGECEKPVPTTVVVPAAQPAVAVAAKPTYTG